LWWSFCVALLLYLLPVNFSSLKSCFGLDFLFAGFLQKDKITLSQYTRFGPHVQPQDAKKALQTRGPQCLFS